MKKVASTEIYDIGPHVSGSDFFLNKSLFAAFPQGDLGFSKMQTYVNGHSESISVVYIRL
jgi:hypothetical protein